MDNTNTDTNTDTNTNTVQIHALANPYFIKDTLESTYKYMIENRNKKVLYMLPFIRNSREILLKESLQILDSLHVPYEVFIKDHKIRLTNNSELIFKPIIGLYPEQLRGLILDRAVIAGIGAISRPDQKALTALINSRITQGKRYVSTRNNSTRTQ